jgi:hypothetical protein
MSKSSDEIIQEAMQRGEFENLPGKGKPLNLSDYFNTPEDVRLAYSIELIQTFWFFGLPQHMGFLCKLCPVS